MKIEISVGELVDKIIILEIKKEKIKSSDKLKNIIREYNILRKNAEDIGIISTLKEYVKLKKINLKLWKIENKIRIKEANKEFDDDFIQLARNIYFTNDERAEIKKKINLKYNSELIEEKEYVDYKNIGK